MFVICVCKPIIDLLAKIITTTKLICKYIHDAYRENYPLPLIEITVRRAVANLSTRYDKDKAAARDQCSRTFANFCKHRRAGSRESIRK